MEKIPVAILGATGLVGQKAIALIARLPQYTICEIAASDKRIGLPLIEAVQWEVPSSIGNLKFKPITEVTSPYVISALPASVAKEVEPMLASRGSYVFSNASALRMHGDVPLLIPEINLSHLSLLEKQKTKGKIITNPNCTTTFIAMALGPLQELGIIKHVSIVTMQAISGAGNNGINSEDIIGNIIPHIEGEEEKIENETRKILGTPTQAASFGITTHVHRVPVVNGHTIALHIHFADEINLDEVHNVFKRRNQQWKGLYHLYEEKDRPQPAKDIGIDDQSVHIGRIKHGASKNILGLIVMGDNLVRGAAGATLSNMEATLEFLKKDQL